MTDETSVILEQIGQMQRNLAELKASLFDRLIKEPVPPGPFDVFVCRALEERYGIPIHLVTEVLPMCRLSDYPQAPSWFSGLLNLRGELIPVLDVVSRFNRDCRTVDVSDFIVIVDVDDRRYGLVFQEVVQVVTIDGAKVQPPMSGVPEALYILGIAETKDAPIFLLSLSCLLGTSDVPEDKE